MIDKREVEEIVLSQIPTKDRSCGWPAFWRDIVVPYREKELIAALTKISQLEQQILEIQGNAAIRFAEAEARWHKAEESKNTAYTERDRLVCAISKVFPSWLERHPDSDVTWEDDWRWIVFVQFPTGQASWHIHDSEESWFDHLERRDGNSWDGHSTTEKYARIERFERIGNLGARQDSAAEGGIGK